jgi:hypothetical protein
MDVHYIVVLHLTHAQYICLGFTNELAVMIKVKRPIFMPTLQ